MRRRKMKKSRRFLQLILIIAVPFISTCSKTEKNPLVGPVVGDITPPAKPALPTLTSVGNGEIHIQWTPNTEQDLKGYRLYRAENNDIYSNYHIIMDSTATSYQDKQLEYTTTYYYRVSAYDFSGNESPKSDPVSGTPYNTTPPGQPQNLFAKAQNITAPLIELSWNSNPESDVRGYQIYRGNSTDFLTNSATFIDSTVNNYYTDTSIMTDTTYYYKIKAYDKGRSESVASNADGDIALSHVILISPVSGQSVSPLPTFSWQPVNHATQYCIIVQSTLLGVEIWKRIVTNTQTTVQYNGTTALEPGRTYYWKVASITKDPIGMNSFSETWSFRVQ